MPWRIIAAYFVPVLAIAFLVYAWHHVRSTVAVAAAIPATRAMAVAFGNSVQLGIPMATALFGEEGLALIGVSLAQYGIKGHWQGATLATIGKLFVLPTAVLLTARFGFGLTGLPLAVLVMMAALPVGTNALLFAQRYGVLEAEATAAIVASTFAFVATAGLWLAVLAVT
jgi:predicted permease